VNYNNLLLTEFDLKDDLFSISSSTHPIFCPDKISEIKKHYSNGLSRFTEKIKVEIVTDLKRCKMLWTKFSPQKTLFDTWNFRYAFHKNLDVNPYFLTIKKSPIIWQFSHCITMLSRNFTAGLGQIGKRTIPFLRLILLLFL